MVTSPSRDASLPSGTVTFLFTDIEGSTSRWEHHGEAMAAALRRHDALVRATMEHEDGRVFKTIGDAFCVAFSSAAAAVAAALDVQRAVAAESWDDVGGLTLRIAVHTGTADERDADYFGPTVNRVARILSVAHGGQCLVSGTAAQLARGQLPTEISLRDLGMHRLRDLAEPEQLYQLVAPDLRDIFPPLLSLDQLPNNLPLQVTSFIERGDEVAQISALLERSRIVTIVGTGGVGKTRTALHIAANMLDGSGDGVWFVELAGLSDPSVVPSAVATALGLAPAAGRTPLETLLAHLKKRHLLLVLDNCEHVIAEAARVAEAIARSAPRCVILATSRESLNVAGEAVYRMPSMGVPPAGTKPSAAEALSYGAVALFVERATFADGRFRFTDDNAPIVADICRRLDGIALAIELAATRVKVIAVQQLSQRLDERFRVLTGGNRTALPRQQTMRALIDWSYDLLTEAEKAIFRRVSIFAGGWTLEAAGDVCSDDTIETWQVLDLLGALVDKSLVATEALPSSIRCRLLESTREYASERLSASGELDSVARRHASQALALAEAAEAARDQTPLGEWLEPLKHELDNFRAALGWSLERRNDVVLGARLTAALYRFFDGLSLYPEGLGWCTRALASGTELPVAVEADVQLAYAFLSANSLRTADAIPALERAISLYEQSGNERSIWRASLRLTFNLAQASRYDEAQQYAAKALGIAHKAGDPLMLANALMHRACALEPTQIERKRELLGESVGSFRTLGRESEAARGLQWWGEFEAAAGAYAQAIAHGREALDIYERIGHPLNALVCLNNIAGYALANDDPAEAAPAARRAFELAGDVNVPVLTAYTLQYLAAIAETGGDGAGAARLLGYTDNFHAVSGTSRGTTEQVPYERLRSRLQERFGEAELPGLLAEGSSWDEERAFAEARLV